MRKRRKVTHARKRHAWGLEVETWTGDLKHICRHTKFLLLQSSPFVARLEPAGENGTLLRCPACPARHWRSISNFRMCWSFTLIFAETSVRLLRLRTWCSPLRSFLRLCSFGRLRISFFRFFCSPIYCETQLCVHVFTNTTKCEPPKGFRLLFPLGFHYRLSKPIRLNCSRLSPSTSPASTFAALDAFASHHNSGNYSDTPIYIWQFKSDREVSTTHMELPQHIIMFYIVICAACIFTTCGPNMMK